MVPLCGLVVGRMHGFLVPGCRFFGSVVWSSVLKCRSGAVTVVKCRQPPTQAPFDGKLRWAQRPPLSTAVSCAPTAVFSGISAVFPGFSRCRVVSVSKVPRPCTRPSTVQAGEGRRDVQRAVLLTPLRLCRSHAAFAHVPIAPSHHSFPPPLSQTPPKSAAASLWTKTPLYVRFFSLPSPSFPLSFPPVCLSFAVSEPPHTTCRPLRMACS